MTVKLAALLYTEETANRRLLWDFAEEMTARGWRVGGLVQDILREPDGRRLGVDAVAMDNGERAPIARATVQSRANKDCILDHAALTDVSRMLRRAVEANADLIVVEKFGEQEQTGAGLMDEILGAVAAGIPTVVALPAHALERWRDVTGGLGTLLPSDLASLRRWWGAENAVAELARGVGGGDAKRVVVGLNWTLVEGPNGCGLAHTPAKGTAGCRPLSDAGAYAGRPLRDLAGYAQSGNGAERALGIAAINAHYNRYDLTGGNENGLDAFAGSSGRIACVGRFPGFGDRYADVQIVEMEPRDDEHPETATEQVMASADGALITSSVLVNGTFPRVLNARGNATDCILIGPGTPLAPALAHYGIGAVSGLVVEDPAAAAHLVAEGGSVKALKRHGRYVTRRLSA